MISEIERLNILIIEDSTQDFILTDSYLSAKFENYKAVHVKTANEATAELEKYKKRSFDIILLDLSLPDKEGETLITFIQAQAPYTPIIILTGYSDLDFSVKSLSLGVSDYLLKDEFTPALLHKSILYTIQRYNFSLKLKKSRDAYSTLLNNIKETVYRSDINDDFNIVFVSSHVQQLTGYPPEHFIKSDHHTLTKLVHNEDRAYVQEYKQKAIKDKRGWKLEYRLVHKDTSIKYVIDSGNVFYDEERGEHYYDGSILDITDRKHIEERLQVREEAFRSTFNNAAIGMGVTDKLGVIQKVNGRLCDILGFSEHELIGKNTIHLVHPAHLRKNLRNISKLLNGDIHYFHSEEKFTNKNGHTVWCILSVSIVRDKDGDPLSFIGQLTDITDKKSIELELEELNLNLENKVKERTRQLQNANKELEAFSYSVSHDLRAPLRAIDGFSQVVLEDYSENLDETGRGYLKRVRNASQKLSQLINHFLTLAKVSRVNLKKETVHITEVAKSVVEILQANEPDRNVTIRIEDQLVAEADMHLIKTVIQNLLENAWKYTAHEKDASIELGRLKKDQRDIYYVKDNGAGFDMNLYDQLFQPFKRLHREKDYEGSGIGLATVKRIIGRHNGAIWAESEVGSGSTFYFTL